MTGRSGKHANMSGTISHSLSTLTTKNKEYYYLFGIQS